MTYKRLYKSFRKFIDQDEHFSEEQQYNILTSFEDEKKRRVFRLSIILLIWSVIGVSIDSFFIGGGVLFSIAKGVDFIYFLPTIIFSVVNFIIKVTFVRWYMKGDIKNTHAAYSGIPYAGSALIISFLLNEDLLFLEGLKHYLKYLRRRGVRFLCRFMYSDKKYNH